MTNPECEVAELRMQLGSGGVTLVDVREFPEYAAGRIPGSRFIPLNQLALRADELDRGCTVFIGAGLAFAAITDSCAMGMMLARLPWNRNDSTQSHGARQAEGTQG